MLTKVFGRTVRAVEVPTIRLHDLRHVHATLALVAGVPVKVLSQRLGHASVQIAWDTYAHVLPDQDEHAAELFDRLVYGPSAGSA